MPNAYTRGLISKAAILGRGTVEIGDVIEGRTVFEMEFRQGRFFVFANAPTPHVIASWPDRMIGMVVRDVPIPEADAPSDPIIAAEGEAITGG